MYYNYNPPFVDITFSNYSENMANGGYGNNIGSYAAYVSFAEMNQSISSGIPMLRPFSATMNDFNGQVVSFVNDVSLSIFSDDLSIVITGETKMLATDGILDVIGAITIKGMPTNSSSLRVTADTLVDSSTFEKFAQKLWPGAANLTYSNP